MTSYSDIGIDSKLDWQRIRKLMIIGLCAGIMVLVGDMLLGWGVSDEKLSGIERKLSTYLTLSDTRIFWSSILGFIGIPLEGLCYFGIYRLMAGKSPKLAHMYRSGIFGYLIFGGCGVHVPCLACTFFYKYMNDVSPQTALESTIKFGAFFLIPGTIMFLIFFIIHSIAQILAFAKGSTPYPKWCWIFSMPVGMVFTYLLKIIGNYEIINALTAGWISIGNIWMFGGLLLMMKKARYNPNERDV